MVIILKYQEFNTKYESITNNDFIDKILWFNNIRNFEDYKKITQSSFPFEFPNSNYFYNKINEYKDKKIVIIGDYDCDGVCATSIMILFLQYLGISCDYIIGDRFIDGYGMNNSLIDKAIKMNASLIITVDNGIKCKENVDYAKEKGIDIIITAHHQPEEECIPNTVIYNPHYKSNLIFKDFCGAFTVFCLIYGYFKYENRIKDSDKSLLFSLYELAALATIGDVMPLYDINRKIVNMLVNHIKNDTIYNKGLSLLVHKLNLDSNTTSSDVAYKLVPVCNAPGRLKNASLIVDLFISKENTINECFNLNEERKNLTKEALKNIEINENAKINVIYIENLSEGIIGIVAGNICEKTNKPTFVFTNDSTGEIKGSGRSIDGYNILIETEKIIKENNLYVKYGGHEGAMGITLKNKECLNIFDKLINESCDLEIIEKTIPYIKAPSLSLKEIYELLENLEPHGQGLILPLLCVEGKPINIKIINDSHSQFSIKNNGEYLNFMAFNKIVEQYNDKFYFEIKKSLYNNKIYYKGYIK